MTPRYLVNDDGSPFDDTELQQITSDLDTLIDSDRTGYRNENAAEIAKHKAKRFLIVSGPGTGKSYLFLERIKEWLNTDSSARILVTSFVRKLVADLQNDINGDSKLNDDQKKQINVSTLHKLARSIVETNNGTKDWPFKKHFRIIGQFEDIVWEDVIEFHDDKDIADYSLKQFHDKLHNLTQEEDSAWSALTKTYYELCKFYNAAGFADLIQRASVALSEKSDLNEDEYFIIDEYQDFNIAEEAFIKRIVNGHKGLLIVGDDDQVLYEELKSGKASLIRDLYANKVFSKGMLPFCGRSTFHITKAANHFISNQRVDGDIQKIFLPLKTSEDAIKVQNIAGATPATAIDYIKKFISDHKTEIDDRKAKLESDDEKDAYLLILTPSTKNPPYGEKHAEIEELISDYKTKSQSYSEDYYRLLTFYSLAKYQHDNFTFRKALHIEGVSITRVHELLEEAIGGGKDFCELDADEVKKIIEQADKIQNILDTGETASEKVEQLQEVLIIENREQLVSEISNKEDAKLEVAKLEHEEEEEAELEEIEVKKMDAIELMSIVGSKGLSADHVIIIGYDNVNMNYVTKNAFYVAITRARKSLHVITALQAKGAKEAHAFLDQLPEAHLEFYKYTKTGHVLTDLKNKRGFKKYFSTIAYAKAQSKKRKK